MRILGIILDLRGPDFLALYLVLQVGALGLGALLRALRPAPDGADGLPRPPEDAFSMAFLAGGAPRAMQAALAGLVHGGAVAVDGTKITAPRPLPADAAPLEAAVYRAVAGRAGGLALNAGTLRSVGPAVADACAALAARLEAAGLLLPARRRRALRLRSAAPSAAVAALGIAKLCVGVSRGRPVGLLLILLAATVLAALMFAAGAPRRTALGDKVLIRHRVARAALRQAAAIPTPVVSPAEVALAVGLYGMEMVRGGPLQAVSAALAPASTSDGGGGGSCGSSSCGGGGCGGGGCGGCGG